MKKLLAFVRAFGWMAGSASAASCPPGQALKKLSSQTASAVVSTEGVELRAVSIQCGGTACVAGLYDTTTEVSVAAGNLVLEIGKPANESILFPETGFLEAPIYLKTGLVFIDNGNVAQITFLSCQPE